MSSRVPGAQPDGAGTAGPAGSLLASGESMVAAAKGIATDATILLSPELLEATRLRQPSTGDPLDDLVARVRPRASGVVDALQVAALLEADGLNDRLARVQYGFQDVFDLADAVYRRLGGSVQRRRPLETPPRSAREVMHGLMYLLPSALFPAVIAVVERRPLVVALLTAGALGWVWGGGASWLAYQGLNAGDHRAAGRVLAWASAVGIAVAAGIGALIALSVGGGVTAAVLVPGVMAYQMASTLLVFYRHELVLAGLMLPAAVLGVAYVALGRGLLPWALAAVVLCVLAALAFALRRAVRAGADQPSPAVLKVRALLRGRVTAFVLVLGYAALSAAFLLHSQAPYLLTHFDVVLAGAPLIVAMGVVEWRARVFAERSRLLLRQVRYPRQFVRRVWLLLAANLALCLLAVGLGAAVLLAALRWVGWLTPAGVAMAAAQVALGGAYFLAFVLASHQRYGSLCVALAASIAAHLGAAWLVAAGEGAPWPDAFTDITLFFGSAVLLQVLLLAALGPILGQVRRHR